MFASSMSGYIWNNVIPDVAHDKGGSGIPYSNTFTALAGDSVHLLTPYYAKATKGWPDEALAKAGRLRNDTKATQCAHRLHLNRHLGFLIRNQRMRITKFRRLF